MSGGVRHFFDVPVYRLPKERYYKEQELHVQRFIDSVTPPPGSPFAATRSRENELALRDHLMTSYGGMWRYNEVIGWIRLHFLGSQVRGEYYSVLAKRIVRTRNKTLGFQTWKLAPELDVPYESDSAAIYNVILEYLDNCKKELRGRHVDTEGIEAVGRLIDWRTLFLEEN